MNSCCHYLDDCIINKCNSGGALCKNCTLKNFACEKIDTGRCPQDFFQSISMMSPDMGLYWKFDINEDGRPVNCTGLTESWIANDDAQSENVICNKNEMPASDGMSMADVVEMYAEHNDAWIKDFIPVYNKMLENGVEASNLKAVPADHWLQF